MIKPENYQFQLIPIPMPPVLPKALQFPEPSRYIALSYEHTNCFVYDGRSGHSDSYYIYRALIEHSAIATYLIPYHLGSDIQLPTHALLIDSEKSLIFVGEYLKTRQFLHQWQNEHNPLPDINQSQHEQLFDLLSEIVEEETRQIKQQIDSGEMQKLLNESIKLEQEYIQQIQQFLDNYIDK